MSAEKKMTPEEANEYMNKVMGFTPRMFKIINTVTPDPGKTFADFYATIFGDGALSKKIKELMFTAKDQRTDVYRNRRILLFPEMYHPCNTCNQRRCDYRRNI
jgi:hypothetical protein